MTTYTLKVVDIRKETKDTITICFKQPALRKIKYKAGQYLTLIFRINGRRYIRPYSFSSAPVVDASLDVTVKRIPKGIVSNHIHDVVGIGDSVEVMSPMGDFIYDRDNQNDLVFLWGAGSGITPLISIIKDIIETRPYACVNLIYGNKDNDTTIFSDLINTLSNKYPERFKVWHFHTQLSIKKDYPYLIQGRIKKESVLEIMKDVDASKSIHYICGPLGLKESVTRGLLTLKVEKSQIHTEDFELVKNPEDFEDINTQLIKLEFEKKCFDLEVIKGKSILETALDVGIELPYSCQTGNCSTCKGVVKEGQLKMIGLTQKREDLKEEEYLLCCSYPLTNNVHVIVSEINH